MRSAKLRTSLRIVHSDLRPPNQYRRNAGNTVHLAQWAKGSSRFEAYQRVADAWEALADADDWLNGRVHPINGRPYRSPSVSV